MIKTCRDPKTGDCHALSRAYHHREGHLVRCCLAEPQSVLDSDGVELGLVFNILPSDGTRPDWCPFDRKEKK